MAYSSSRSWAASTTLKVVIAGMHPSKGYGRPRTMNRHFLLPYRESEVRGKATNEKDYSEEGHRRMRQNVNWTGRIHWERQEGGSAFGMAEFDSRSG